MGNLYCPKCDKTMRDVNFYTYKDGSKCELCKSCLTMHINNWEPDTFLWILEKFDVPYMPEEWNILRDRAYQKDPYKMTGMSVLGKYLAKMKLRQYNTYGWADTEKLKKQHEDRAKLYGNPNQISKEKIEKMEEAFKNGEISEAQLLTYKETVSPPPAVEPEPAPQPAPPHPYPSPQNDIYPTNTDRYMQVDLPDVGAELTDEDKIYLATKWGQLYTPSDWVYLEKKYDDFLNSFDIQGAARIDTLIQICKLSLKLNQALDSGDMDAYAKLVRAYDTLMKSAKFTEAQRKEEKSGEFDSVGQIVYYAEKEGGKIPRYDISTPLDIVDKAINNLKKYNRDLVVNDPTLSQMFENFIKMRENVAAAKKNQEEAEEKGLDYVQIEDKDYIEFNELKEDVEAKK